MTSTTPRWKYRFKNFSGAYALLREAGDKYAAVAQINAKFLRCFEQLYERLADEHLAAD